MSARPGHRLRQFFGALRPTVGQRAREDAYHYLTPQEQTLFETMTIRDQQHGIIVMRRVRAERGDDRPLCTAALLHDCGKGEVALWQRVLHVLLGVSPAARNRIASPHGAGWRRAMWRLLHHPQIGADLAQVAGAEADVVRMIREQDAAGADPRLAILQAADDM